MFLGVIRRGHSSDGVDFSLRDCRSLCNRPATRCGLSLVAFVKKKQKRSSASLLRKRSRQSEGARVLMPSEAEADPRFVPIKTLVGVGVKMVRNRRFKIPFSSGDVDITRNRLSVGARPIPSG